MQLALADLATDKTPVPGSALHFAEATNAALNAYGARQHRSPAFTAPPTVRGDKRRAA